ncbi:replication-relaxation family protein [Candidatus Saccharibacteria bacterium]|nr:replication-relaxation family protein [Candidatus Saccharibacteria bacterium]
MTIHTMTNNDTPRQPKYRRPLNDKQILILKLLYKFRFLTVGLLQTAQGHKYQATHNDRLKVLYQQEYIGRHYNDTYRIDRRYAEYFILPKGINALKDLGIFRPTTLKNLYKDKSAKSQFIAHSLGIFELYNTFRRLYPDTFSFYTKTELTGRGDMPGILPDAYLKPKDLSSAKDFYLDYVDDLAQLLLVKRKIISYFKHADSDEWQDSGKPYTEVLLVTELESTQKTLHKYIDKKLSYTGLDITFYTTTKKALIESNSTDERIWHRVGEDEPTVLGISTK